MGKFAKTILVVWLTVISVTAVGAWSSAVNVSNDPYRAHSPAMVRDSSNNLHLVWYGGASDSSQWVVKYQKYNGSSWSSPYTLSGAGAGHPDIAIDGNDDLHVVWHASSNPEDIYYRKCTNGTWGSTVNLSNTSTRSLCPKLAVNSSGSVVLVVWHEGEQNSGTYDIFAKSCTNGSWDGNYNVSNDWRLSRNPEIACDSNGDFHVVWEDTDIDVVYFITRYTNQTWSSRISLDEYNSGRSYGPSIAANGTKLHVAWHDDTEGEWEIYYKYFDGSNWGSVTNISSHYGITDAMANVAVDSNNQAQVVWSDYSKIYYTYQLGGVWQTREKPIQVSSSKEPEIILDSNDNRHVVCMSNNGSWQIYYSNQDAPTPQNYCPSFDDAYVSSSTLYANGSTEYTVTLKASDSNGVSEIQDMRVMFNIDTVNWDQSTARGYLAWGKTQSDVTYWGGNWDIYSSGGEGYWGIYTDGWGYSYITPVSATTSTSGNQRTVTWTFKVNTNWTTPATGNYIGMHSRDLQANTDWQRSDSMWGYTFNVSTNGAISGTVKDSAGNGISGATVSTTSGGYTTTTNTSGAYTLSNVVAGTYDVVASHTDYESATNTGVSVTAGYTTTSNFTLTAKPGSITGTVKDSSNNAISGATVATSCGTYSTTTASDGSYTLSNVEVGTYDVVASATGYQSATNTGVVVNPNAATTSNFTLEAVSAEKVSNGDMEGGFFSTGWATTCSGLSSKLPNDWGWNNESSYPFNTFDSTGTKHGGSHALGFAFCQTASAPGKIGVAVQNVYLGANNSATFSVWAYHTDGNCPSVMCWNPGAGANDPYTAESNGRYQWVTTDNWGQRNQWLNRTMTVTADSSGYVTIMVGGTAWPGTASGARLYIDDVSVQ